jgi:hypothetical protein
MWQQNTNGPPLSSYGRVHAVSAPFNITKFEQHSQSNSVFKYVESTLFNAT